MVPKNFNQKKVRTPVRGAKGTVGARMGGSGPKKVVSLDSPLEAPRDLNKGVGPSAPPVTDGGQMSQPIPGVGGVTPGAVNRRLGIPAASMQLGDPAAMRPSNALRVNTPNAVGVAPGSFTAPLSRIAEIMQQKARR